MAHWRVAWLSARVVSKKATYEDKCKFRVRSWLSRIKHHWRSQFALDRWDIKALQLPQSDVVSDISALWNNAELRRRCFCPWFIFWEFHKVELSRSLMQYVAFHNMSQSIKESLFILTMDSCRVIPLMSFYGHRNSTSLELRDLHRSNSYSPPKPISMNSNARRPANQRRADWRAKCRRLLSEHISTCPYPCWRTWIDN